MDETFDPTSAPEATRVAYYGALFAMAHADGSIDKGATGPNPVGTLPATSCYQDAPRVAAYVSPPFSEYTKLIFKISSNLGADLMLCLMAARAGSTNCEDGFPVLGSFLAKAHVDRKQVVLADGHGGPIDRFTLQAVTDLLRFWRGRPDFARFRQMLPILGEPGNLAGICTHCPAQGKVFAKTGTVASYDTFNNRLTLDEALGGYLEVKPGQFYIFDLAVNNAVVPLTGILPVFDDLANLSAFLQEDAAA